MTKKDLKKFSRMDLLEMTLELTRENEKLREELAAALAQLESRRIQIATAGSIAEAAVRLQGIFEAAQAAADQYLENVREACIP